MIERRARASAKAPDTAFVSLGERMAYLQMLRVAFAAIVIGYGIFERSRALTELPRLAIITAAYLAITATAEAVRRLIRRPGIAHVGGRLIVDGLYLAW